MCLGVPGRVLEVNGSYRLDDHLDRELAELTRGANSADFARGLEAFFAKRDPMFKGT